MTPVALTLFRKSGGQLTKRISLDAMGGIVSDGSACLMASGTAQRIQIRNITELGTLIATLEADQALGLGALRPDLPDQVAVVTKRRLAQINGMPGPDLIARTGEAVRYQPNQPALVLFDHDRKGMPAEVDNRLKQCGGLWKALVSVLPALSGTARLRRASTSAGLWRTMDPFVCAWPHRLRASPRRRSCAQSHRRRA
jgi:hypothetical protein